MHVGQIPNIRLKFMSTPHMPHVTEGFVGPVEKPLDEEVRGPVPAAHQIRFKVPYIQMEFLYFSVRVGHSRESFHVAGLRMEIRWPAEAFDSHADLVYVAVRHFSSYSIPGRTPNFSA